MAAGLVPLVATDVAVLGRGAAAVQVRAFVLSAFSFVPKSACCFFTFSSASKVLDEIIGSSRLTATIWGSATFASFATAVLDLGDGCHPNCSGKALGLINDLAQGSIGRAPEEFGPRFADLFVVLA